MLSKLRLPLLAVSVVAFVAALGYWNIRPESFSPDAEVAPADTVDFYATNTRIRQFQADGSLKYDLTAPQFTHSANTDIGLVSEPRMTLHQGTQNPWLLQSQVAEIAPRGDAVEMIDQVRIARTDPKGRDTILTTSRLTVFPDKEYAQTQQPVRIEAAQGVTTAQGMQAYLNEGRLLLLSNVRGQHEVR